MKSLFSWAKKQFGGGAQPPAAESAADKAAVRETLLALKRAKGDLSAHERSRQLETRTLAEAREQTATLNEQALAALRAGQEPRAQELAQKIADFETRIANLEALAPRRAAEAEQRTGEVSKFRNKLVALTDEATARDLEMAAGKMDGGGDAPLFGQTVLGGVDRTEFFAAEKLATSAVEREFFEDDTVLALKATGAWQGIVVRPDQVIDRLRYQLQNE